MCSLQRDGDVFILTFAGEGQHRLNPTSMAAIHDALDEVEKAQGSIALVTTNEGRFFSNGLDLEYVMKNKGKTAEFIQQFQDLLARMLVFPIPTVAAICGHAAAGGCMLALAHDYQIMRSDKGYIFLNEVDINLPLTPGMNTIVQCKLPSVTYREAVLTARKYDGKAALAGGIITQVEPNSSAVLSAAVNLASSLAARKWTRPVYEALKKEMYKVEEQLLREGGQGYGATVGALAAASKL